MSGKVGAYGAKSSVSESRTWRDVSSESSPCDPSVASQIHRSGYALSLSAFWFVAARADIGCV